jgi:hypothetical protein
MNALKLCEKAILVKLSIRRPRLMNRDENAEIMLQRQLDDASLIVNSRLFRDRANPVNLIMSSLSEVYTYHRKHTLAHIDKGERILPNALFDSYTSAINHLILCKDSLVSKHMPNYDQYVQDDIRYRSQNTTTSRASVSDYPSAQEFRDRLSVSVQFAPMPDKRHFLFDLPEEQIAEFERAQADAAAAARADTIGRMLDPLKHLVDKLALPIGDKGSIFRNSAIDNILDGIEIARKLNIDESDEVNDAIRELTKSVALYADNVDAVRESPIVRKQAHTELNKIADRMSAFMGGI